MLNLKHFNQPADVKIDGNKVTVTMQAGNTTTVEEMTDITLTDTEFNYTSKFCVYKDGEMIDDMLYKLHCTKLYDDYSQIILGRWEGTITSDEPDTSLSHSVKNTSAMALTSSMSSLTVSGLR